MSGLRSVLVLGGGRSAEHEVSLASAASVADGLEQAGHTVRRVLIDRQGGWWHVERFEQMRPGAAPAGAAPGRGAAPAALALTPGAGIDSVDVVFPVLHGPYGEDGVIQGLLEALGVPYVGSGVLASALCMDKIVFKQLMAAFGLPQVAYRALALDDWRADPGATAAAVLEALGLPLFVKPARLGSSVGISRVLEREQLAGALEQAFRFDPRVIVEAAARGIEVECAVLGGEEPVASTPGEIMLSAGESGWYDYAAKYTPGAMRLIAPARISPAARARVRTVAVQAFRHAGCAGLARADFFVDGERVLLNELNTMPGFTETSVYGALWRVDGVAYPDLLHRLVAVALTRACESVPL